MLLTPMLAMLALVLSAGFASAIPGGTTIGGCLYAGNATVTYGPDAATGNEIIAYYQTDYAPSPNTPPITDGQVMVQDQHNGGAFITYGTMGLMTDFAPGEPGGPPANCWEAVVDPLLTPDIIVTISAPEHGTTSREWTWDPDGRYGAAGEFVHPSGPDVRALELGGTGTTSIFATGAQDAYLPALPLADANLLHYVFYDEFPNGNPNGADVEFPIQGVNVCIYDGNGDPSAITGDPTDLVANGNAVQCKLTGAEAFTTADGQFWDLQQAAGYVYFTGLPTGQYEIASNADGVSGGPLAAQNTHLHFTDAERALRSPMWYQTMTEHAGHVWDADLGPGHPGTDGGGMLTFHAFIENFGNDAGGNPFIAGSIHGNLMDADAPEPLPQANGGRVPPTGARYENGVLWDINSNIGSCQLGFCPPVVPGPSNQDILMNGSISHGRLALYRGGDFPQLMATTEASDPGGFNEPFGADFDFVNVPPGDYFLFIFDQPLFDVPEVGVGVTVQPLQVTQMGNVLMPRFGARNMGFVTNVDTGAGVPGVEVKTTIKSGDTEWLVTSNDTDVPYAGAQPGWFLNEFFGEAGTVGTTYVDIKSGDTFRGTIITEDFQQVQCGALIPCVGGGILPVPVVTPMTHNSMSRNINWATINYFMDIQVENIPGGEGYVIGNVFYDYLSLGDWVGNYTWDETKEVLRQGVTVNLLDAAGAVVATTTTGSFNEDEAVMQGLINDMPASEVGSVTAGPVVCGTCVQQIGDPAPMNGFYEFRNVAPGTYRLAVVPEPGFSDPFGKFFTSLNGNGIGLNVVNADGTPYNATVRDEDILFYDGTNFHMFFDGSMAGLPGNADIDALHVVDEDTFYASFAGATTAQTVVIDGITYDDEDVLLYDAGVWSLYFDGGANGLADHNIEDITTLHILDDGRMVFSTRGSGNSGNATVNPTPLVTDPAGAWTGRNPRPLDEDLLVYDPATGYIDLYFDGSDIALNTGAAEKVWGAAVAPNGDIYLSVRDGFTTDTGLTGPGYDVFACRGAATVIAAGPGNDDADSTCVSQEIFFNAAVDAVGFNTLNHETLDAVSLYGLGLADDVVVPAGVATRVDLATATIDVTSGRLFGVPLAGEFEGGLFSGMGDLDPNLTSNWFDESYAMNGGATAFYDHNNYFVGVMYNGDPWCNWMNNNVYVPGSGVGFACSTSHPEFLDQGAEAERRFSSGILRSIGNDKAFTVSNVPAAEFGPLLPNIWAHYDSMELWNGVGQGRFVPELAWTPLVTGTGLLPAIGICATTIVGTANNNGDGTWSALADITVTDQDGFSVAGAIVTGDWNPTGGGAVNDCTTAGNPSTCLVAIGDVNPTTATETVYTIANVEGPAWPGIEWNYDPAAPGCVDNVVIASPMNWPPVAVPQALNFEQDSVNNAITLTGNDPEGGPITYNVVLNEVVNGTLTGAAPNLFYAPNAGFTGADSFTFTVTDDQLQTSAPATVNINVNTAGGGGAPVATVSSVVVDEGEKWLVDVTATVTLGGAPVVGQEFEMVFDIAEGKTDVTDGAGQFTIGAEIDKQDGNVLNVDIIDPATGNTVGSSTIIL